MRSTHILLLFIIDINLYLYSQMICYKNNLQCQIYLTDVFHQIQVLVSKVSVCFSSAGFLQFYNKN